MIILVEKIHMDLHGSLPKGENAKSLMNLLSFSFIEILVNLLSVFFYRYDSSADLETDNFLFLCTERGLDIYVQYSIWTMNGEQVFISLLDKLLL
jgi:hypothetical protein